MSAEAVPLAPAATRDLRTVRVVRYAVGSTLALGVAMAGDWTLSYLSVVLALSFLATPDPCPSLKLGVAFVVLTAVASGVGFLLTKWLLPYPFVFVPLTGLILFRLFHAGTGGAPRPVILLLLISVLLLPLVGLLSPELTARVAVLLPLSALIAILHVWTTYLFFPDPEEVAVAPAPKPPVPPPGERFRLALDMTLVVLPVFILFFTLRLAGAALVLVFVALLTAQPGFAKDFRAGAALVLGNLIGGGTAILFYEALVLVPRFEFLLLLTLLAGLLFGARVFGGGPAAPLFAMAFSTVMLIIGSTTSGDAEAGGKAITRVVQIMIAVVWVVLASGVLERFRARREATA